MRSDPLGLSDHRARRAEAAGAVSHLRVLEGEQKAETDLRSPPGRQPVVEQLPRPDDASAAAGARARGDAPLGVGSGSVRSIAGTMDIHMELERRLADFKQTEAVVVFQSGFAANAGTVAAVLSKDDVVISDELNHASIIDGCRLSRAAIKVFPHKDVDAARQIVAELPAAQRKLLITDGVFSMDGDLGALPELCDARRGIRLHHDGRRCARERRVRPERPRHDRSLRHARPRGHPGRHAVEGDRRARRLRRRQPRADRLPLSPRAPVSVLDVAPARRRGRVHRGDRRAASRSRRSSIGCGRTRGSSRPACRRSASTPASAKARSRRSSSATARWR